MFIIIIIRYLILFSVVNIYAVKLGWANVHKDKDNAKMSSLSLLLFFTGMVCGILYML